MFDEDDLFRSTVVMARHAFGEGSYRYFADPLPPLVQTLRTRLYPPIARVANAWAERLGEPTFPDTLDGLLDRCARAGQTKPTPLVLRYGPGGYNCLHQDVYGDLTFPLQFLVMLAQARRGLHRRRERVRRAAAAAAVAADRAAPRARARRWCSPCTTAPAAAPAATTACRCATASAPSTAAAGTSWA